VGTTTRFLPHRSPDGNPNRQVSGIHSVLIARRQTLAGRFMFLPPRPVFHHRRAFERSQT